MATSTASAVNGTWVNPDPLGTGPWAWESNSYWSGGIVAGGTDGIADFTADFLNKATTTVIVDTARSVGGLIFEDTTTKNFGSLRLTGAALTLDVSSGTPEVNARDLIQSTSGELILACVISGNDGLRVTGGNEVLLTNAGNDYTGTTIVDGGVLVVSPGTIPGTGRTVTGTNLGVVAFAAQALDNALLTRFIENSNAFIIATSLSTANDIDLNSSTGANLSHASLGALASGNVTYSGTVTPNNDVYRFGGGIADTVIVDTPLVDAGNARSLVVTRKEFLVAKPPTVQLRNAGNTFSGGTTVSNGALLELFGDDSKAGTGAVTLDRGRITFNGYTNIAVPIVLAAGGGTIEDADSLTINSSITGGGDLTLDGEDGVWMLGSAFAYTGATILQGGTLFYKLTADNCLPYGTPLTLNKEGNGDLRLDLNGYNQTVGGLLKSGLSLNYYIGVVNSSPTYSTLTISNDTDISVTANIGKCETPKAAADPTMDNLGLTKIGSGTLTLANSFTNSYTGDLTVKAGILSVSFPEISTNANVTVDSGAVLNLNFTGTDTVSTLTLAGVTVDQGVWGAIGSSAENETDRITGTGLLNVLVSGIPAGTILIIR